MALISRRLFLIVPPAVLAATWFGESGEGFEAINAPPLAGAKRASGADAKGFRHAQLKGAVTVIHALASSRPECLDEVALWHDFVSKHRFQIAGLFVRDNEADARNASSGCVMFPARLSSMRAARSSTFCKAR